jgi:DNA-directed RNA polymerase subunit beta
MPRSPWGDPVQIIFNPLSIVNRMNPGQIYEMYVGTIAKLASRQLIAMGTKKTQKAINLISAIYRGLDNTKGKKYSAQVIKLFTSMNPKTWSEFITDMGARGEFLPIVCPHFQSPSKQMISKVMKVVGLKNAYKLHLPEHNKKTLREIAIGWMYFNKLEQQATIKMGARSTSLYQGKTGQPTEGKKRDGGQRAGEMDVNALLSHNCENILKEFMGPLSDDQKTKGLITADIIQYGEAKYREPVGSPTRDLMIAYMTALALES